MNDGFFGFLLLIAAAVGSGVLVGAFGVTVTPAHVNQATTVCINNGGYAKIVVVRSKVQCVDGAEFNVDFGN